MLAVEISCILLTNIYSYNIPEAEYELTQKRHRSRAVASMGQKGNSPTQSWASLPKGFCPGYSRTLCLANCLLKIV